MIVLLFLTTALIMGLCQGITSLGTSQIYGISVPNEKRNRMVFAQATISGILAILVVWITRDLLASDQNPCNATLLSCGAGSLPCSPPAISFAGVRLLEEEQARAPAPDRETQTAG